jgi:hypothetical protein
LVADVCNVGDLEQYVAGLPLADWRRIAGNHWVVPVWFLVRAEGFDTDRLVAQLKPDSHEVDAVVDLARCISACS